MILSKRGIIILHEDGLGDGHGAYASILCAKIEEVGADRVVKLNYSRGEQTITIPASATVVAFDKAPADQLAVGRKVFVVMKKDGSEAAAVVIGAEGVKPPM